MAVTNFHSRYGVTIDTLVTSVPVIIGGITKQDIQINSEVVADPTSGDIYPRHVAIHAHKPVATFTTHALQDCIDEIGLTGDIVENNGYIFYAQKFTEGSTPTAGSVHRKYTINEGVAVLRRLSCDDRGDAELDVEILCTSDGTNAPIVEADSTALPTAAVDNERFTLGNIILESVAITQVTNLEIDFGVDAKTVGSNSDIYDTFSAIRTVMPKITITSSNIAMLAAAAIPSTGKVLTDANTTIYLRKRSTTASGFVADGTAEHILINATGMAVIKAAFNDGDKDPCGVTIEITCSYDGTNAPIVIATAVANV